MSHLKGMNNTKKIVAWVLGVGIAVIGLIAVGCATMDLDSGYSDRGGYAPSPAPAAPC